MARLKSEWIKNGEGNEEVEAVADACREKAQQLIDKGRLLTAALYHYRNMLFLYYEEVRTDGGNAIAPDDFMGAFAGALEKGMRDGGMVSWMKKKREEYKKEFEQLK